MTRSAMSPGLRAVLAQPENRGRFRNSAGTIDIETLNIPSNATELESMLSDSKVMSALATSGHAKFGEFLTNYARAQYDKDLSIKAQVTEQVQVAVAQLLTGDENGKGIERLDLRNFRLDSPDTQPRNAVHNPRAIGAKLDNDFKSASEFFNTIWHHTTNTVDVQNRRSKLKAAFSSDVPNEGGFLIPETLRAEILRVALEAGIVRQRARVIPMETLRVPFPMIDATSNVSSVHGGIVTYWTEESAALTESQPSFGRIVLEAKKLTAYTTVPNELMSDSIGSFETYISDLFPEAVAFAEDVAFIKGNGVGQPLGALHPANTSIVSVAKETGQPAATIVWENIVKMFSRMLPSSLNRAVWVVSPDTFPELATMALSVGTGGSAVWLNNGVQGPPMTILGRPVIVTEKAPGLLGGVGDISFVDFGFYLVGDRQAMSAKSSEHVKFNEDSTAFRIIERVDGRPWLQSGITPQNGGPALSAFVTLAARA
jgi:HK97 family phage major capsid protein